MMNRSCIPWRVTEIRPSFPTTGVLVLKKKMVKGTSVLLIHLSSNFGFELPGFLLRNLIFRNKMKKEGRRGGLKCTVTGFIVDYEGLEVYFGAVYLSHQYFGNTFASISAFISRTLFSLFSPFSRFLQIYETLCIRCCESVS